MDPRLYSTLKTLARPVPDDLAYRYGHRVARASYLRYLRDRLGPYARDVDPGPLPPDDIILTTRSMDESERAEHGKADQYFAGSYKTVHTWLRILESHGFNLRTCGSVFELGTGSARLLRMFRAIEGLRLIGSDVVADDVAWCRENIPGAEFYQNRLEPPLEFANDGEFDLVLAASVFTHIPLEWQQDWLREIHRVLRPGGFFLCTVIGWFDGQRQLTDADREQMRTEGSVTVSVDHENVSLSSKALQSWDIHQARWVVLREFGRVFEVLDYMPDKQDLLVLRRPLEVAVGRQPGASSRKKALTPLNSDPT